MPTMEVLPPPTSGRLPQLDISGFDAPADLAGQLELAKWFANATSTVPPIYHDKPADILATFYQAKALDIPVMTALHNVHWDAATCKGALSAQLMGGLLLRGGVVWESKIDSGKSVEMTFTRLDGRPAGTCTWTIGEAVTAGLAGRLNWQLFPTDNLYARCLSRGSRRFAPDLMLGLGYTLEELRDMQRPDDVDPVDDRKVTPEVTAFLASMTDQTPAVKIRALIEQAKTKKVNLADEYAGDGMTVAERLHRAWIAAATREAEASTAAADAVAPKAGEPVPDHIEAEPDPEAAAAPAGTGNLPCGCPAATVLNTGTHREGCRDHLPVEH